MDTAKVGTECGSDMTQQLPDGTLNGHYHFADGSCDLEPPYSMGGPA